jgi:eukaryotic-like serine/threonine-protein kinase
MWVKCGLPELLKATLSAGTYTLSTLLATQQKEAPRQELLEKIASEIHESLDREDFAQAQDRVTRALESLPGEGLLVRLKVEIESRKRAFDTRQAVRAAS